MYTAVITFSITEIVILQAGAIILGIAIYFFIVSRKTLQAAMAPPAKKFSPAATREAAFLMDRFSFTPPVTKARKKINESDKEALLSFAPVKKSETKDMGIDHFREATGQRPSYSSSLHSESEDGEEYLQLRKENIRLKKSIAKLESIFEKQEAEIEQARAQADLAQQMEGRMEEVFKEFNYLQQKIANLEAQARQSAALAVELEEARQTNEQLSKEVLRKQIKLEEAQAENQRLQQAVHQTEDELTEANQQRQQLSKRAQLMQELNSDMQQMADNNKKWQTDIRRIGELESMLHTMEEERALLKRSGKK